MKYREPKAKELNSWDIESGAVVFSAANSEFANLSDFGNACVHTIDGEGDFLIEPWTEKEYEPHNVSENIFWKNCVVKEYLTANAAVQKGKCNHILCFWNEWNNSFFAFETENEYIGVAWWTTA